MKKKKKKIKNKQQKEFRMARFKLDSIDKLESKCNFDLLVHKENS